ncbi:hypothetical protein IV38_GL001140 [Lactobacillus selangorensis]|uniref:Uncharacterized protein n=1 Tax=Lactobacillus selangorensis TaxID=81857 RepID=A0A0R2FJW5_9LACO|nr:hypothetical protein IV38_GL001140 [Lactobacillus selangorensis]KRN32660.1 hypothetical protein IV40_GL000713 [Lactobacillus selangorensis]
MIYFLALTLVVEGIIRLRVGRQVERATGDRNPYYGGISLLILAVILLLFAKPLASLLPVVLGILLIVYGLQKLGFARRNQRFVNVTPWPAYVYGILVLLLGAVVLFHPFGSLLFLLRGVGIVMCIMAISEIIGLFIYKN